MKFEDIENNIINPSENVQQFNVSDINSYINTLIIEYEHLINNTHHKLIDLQTDGLPIVKSVIDDMGIISDLTSEFKFRLNYLCKTLIDIYKSSDTGVIFVRYFIKKIIDTEKNLSDSGLLRRC